MVCSNDLIIIILRSQSQGDFLKNTIGMMHISTEHGIKILKCNYKPFALVSALELASKTMHTLVKNFISQK